MTPVERFQDYLSTQNLRLTKERRRVVEEVFSTTGHFTISELLQRMQESDSCLGRSTVYRLIPLLLHAGMIFEVAAKEGREEQLYENTMSARHHDHLTCEICGEVIEFEEDGIHDLEENIAVRHGYKLRRHVHHLRGICPACQDRILSREVNAW